MLKALLILFYIFSPLGILYLCYRYKFFNKIGAILLAYITGILLSTSGLLANNSIEEIQEKLMSVCIPLGIPLLLFSSDLKKTLFLARGAFISLLSALIGVISVVIIGYFIFEGSAHYPLKKVAGMLVGVYTGGTPNMAALKMILDVDELTFIKVHTYDMLLSTVYLFFLLSFGKKVFEWILPKFKRNNKTSQQIEANNQEELFWGLLKKKNRTHLIKALGWSILIVALGAGIMFLVAEKSKMAVFILSITTFSILASFNNKIKTIPKSFDLGMYFILIFSVVVASKLSFQQLLNVDISLFLFVTFVLFLSLFVHTLFARIFKVDADTVIITSTALICSPPFVPVLAGTLNNKEMIIPGITIGVIGYAIGNYLGYILFQLLVSL